MSVAAELIDIAKELTARAPQMDQGKPTWGDLRPGDRFKYKRKWWIKKNKTKAVEDYDPAVMIVRHNSLDW